MFTDVYVHQLDPILISAGPLNVGWYGVMYMVSFLLFWWRLSVDAQTGRSPIEADEVANLVTYIILGVILGGRLGWVLFYGLESVVADWTRIYKTWEGGMSFHGGVLGVLVAFWLYARWHNLKFLQVADATITYGPIGLFFGRIGNFINGELWGQPTDGTWGVIFPSDAFQMPRHPSQLYEAALEGAVLLVMMLWARKNYPRPGVQSAVFLAGYGLFRILVELVRVPDSHIGYAWGWVTRGQMLSLPMLVLGIGWLVWIFRQPAPAAPAPASPAKASAAKPKKGRKAGK